jgi:uncharacterized protein
MVARVETLVPQRELESIVRRIVEAYDPDKIILFGSRAYGTPDADSDFDLLILKETTEPSSERWNRVREAVWPLRSGKSIEPVVVTQAELRQRLRFGDQFFDQIVRQGKTIYDRNSFTRRQIEALLAGTQPMAPEDSPIPDEWYKMAERDFGAAKVLLRDSGEFLVPAGIFLQQAVEKYLKGYLLSKGWKLVRTHDLNALLNNLVEHESDFADFNDACSQITKLYFENRYSLNADVSPSRAGLEQLFAQAGVLIARIQSRIAPPAD